MTHTDKPTKTAAPSLESLLQRSDIWKGHVQKQGHKEALDSGYPELNQQLLNNGWPLGSLIEVVQPTAGTGDWQLFTPALKTQLTQQPNTHAVLLNPPARPFAPALIDAKIPLAQLLVVQTHNKTDFIAAFVELARASCCSVLMAWQPKELLNYTELRKCQLATADRYGLTVLFRSFQAQQQSSPAAIRLIAALTRNHLTVTLFKQRGQLQQARTHPIELPLPKHWRALPPHNQLDQAYPSVASSTTNDYILARYNRHINNGPITTEKKVALKQRYGTSD
ncbi:translesion DNA synthesis-associated protein ImuA [Teredinibacter purpureus]|uniref:translesion DNA synthesis-associated protein ImuA n=1 Tax=Teredinibacter purpureus TaxID=2731756 RepID=UPI0005F8792C|nr:translesion DNA synthesis-associated protein ImuA [Teredinibacter purpureus]